MVEVTNCDIDRSGDNRCQSQLFRPDVYYGSMKCKWKSCTTYTIEMTIYSVNREKDQTTWYWLGGRDELADTDNVLGQCDLDVYSFQSNPVCDNIGVTNNGNTVSWTCTVRDVYPQMDCRFQYRKGSSGSWTAVTSNHFGSQHTTDDGDFPPRTTYRDYTCTLYLPINLLIAGTNQFRFQASVVSGSSVLESKSWITSQLTFVMPEVDLYSDCPIDNYIKAGDNTKTCTCHLKDAGIPPGVAQWTYSGGTNTNRLVGQPEDNGDRVLTLSFKPDDPKPTYTCQGYSSLGPGPSKTFQPKFAYGPTIIAVSLNDNKLNVQKCDSDTSFSMYCDLPMDNVSPKPSMVVAASDGSDIQTQSDNGVVNHYRYSYKVFPQKGGLLTITCLATNTEFPELNTKETKSITIQEPPLSRPVVTVMSTGRDVIHNSRVTVTNGDTIEFQCRVDGGFPGVDTVTVKCGNEDSTNVGPETRYSMTVKKDNNDMKCTCQATHVTNCYDQTLDFTLNVPYPSTVTSYKANSKSDLTVSADDDVKFVCETEGNPRPDVTLRGQRSQEIVFLTDTLGGNYETRSEGTKRMTCKDTDMYTCTADNGVGASVYKTISVFVKCVPEIDPVSWHNLIDQVYEPTNGTDLKIEIPIIGHPPPIGYSLKKMEDNTDRRVKRAVTQTEVDEDVYNVTYQAGPAPPEGTVILWMIGLNVWDSGRYVLNIRNGIGSGLDYTFNVSIAEDDEDRGVCDCDDEYDSILGLGIGIGVGVTVAIFVLVFTSFLLWRKVKKNRPSQKQQPQQQRSQQQEEQHQQPHQQQQKQQQSREQNLQSPLRYEEIVLDDYDTLQENGIREPPSGQESPNHYMSIEPQSKGRRRVHGDVEMSHIRHDNQDFSGRRSQGYDTTPKQSETSHGLHEGTPQKPLTNPHHNYVNHDLKSSQLERPYANQSVTTAHLDGRQAVKVNSSYETDVNDVYDDCVDDSGSGCIDEDDDGYLKPNSINDDYVIAD